MAWGAGPGDPDLLTAKALRLTQRCDVVLYNRQLPPGTLDRVRRDAEFVAVGKTPGGGDWRQGEINALMIERAKRGQRVLRLQGGDPTMFGRAGEELDALRKEGIEPLIVPGVTAAAAAACQLGVPSPIDAPRAICCSPTVPPFWRPHRRRSPA